MMIGGTRDFERMREEGGGTVIKRKCKRFLSTKTSYVLELGHAYGSSHEARYSPDISEGEAMRGEGGEALCERG